MYYLFSRCVPQRYLVSVELFFCLTISYMMRFCLSITITEMADLSGRAESGCVHPQELNQTEHSRKSGFNWTPHQRGLIHGSFFWGYFMTSVIGGVLSDLFNHKTVMLTGLLTTSVGTIVTPIVTSRFDWLGLMGCRLFVGLAQGVFYNSLLAVAAHWIPPAERGTLGTLVFSGSIAGSSINALTTGFIMYYSGWELPFYTYSGIALVLVIIFFFTTRSDPSDVPHLSVRESMVFEGYKYHVIDKKSKAPKKIPLALILKNVHVWMIILASFGQAWCFFFLVVFVPSYFKEILHMPTKRNGTYNCMMFLAMWLMAMVSGIVIDVLFKKEIGSHSGIKKTFHFVGCLLPACSFITITFVECHELAVTTIMILGISALGFFLSTVKVNALDLSPNYASTIGSLAQLGTCAAGVFLAYVYSVLSEGGSIKEWRVMFWIDSVLLLIGGFAFVIWGSVEKQPFNDFYADYLFGGRLSTVPLSKKPFVAPAQKPAHSTPPVPAKNESAPEPTRASSKLRN